MGAVQAQDYAGGLWAIGARLPRAREDEIDRAIAERQIVRTWPMRGTLHFVPAADIGWMLPLLTPRAIGRAAGRYRSLALDEAAFRRARTLIGRTLLGGKRLTRAELYAALARGGLPPDGQRGIHILGHLAQQGLICFGPRRDRQPTFVLLDEWLPSRRTLTRDEGLATLAARYFTSHGPATVHDFAWWTGLTLQEARRAVDAAGTRLDQTPSGSGLWRSAALLPPWDEFLVAYRDRAGALDLFRGAHAGAIGRPLVLLGGRVRGSWRRQLTPTAGGISLEMQGRLTAPERRLIEAAVEKYATYLDRPVDVTLTWWD